MFVVPTADAEVPTAPHRYMCVSSGWDPVVRSTLDSAPAVSRIHDMDSSAWVSLCLGSVSQAVIVCGLFFCYYACSCWMSGTCHFAILPGGQKEGGFKKERNRGWKNTAGFKNNGPFSKAPGHWVGRSRLAPGQNWPQTVGVWLQICLGFTEATTLELHRCCHCPIPVTKGKNMQNPSKTQGVQLVLVCLILAMSRLPAKWRGLSQPVHREQGPNLKFSPKTRLWMWASESFQILNAKLTPMCEDLTTAWCNPKRLVDPGLQLFSVLASNVDSCWLYCVLLLEFLGSCPRPIGATTRSELLLGLSSLFPGNCAAGLTWQAI